MPNTHTTLTSLFSDIADAIRAKTGSTEDIVADNFPSAISSIITLDYCPNIEPLSVTENGTYTAPTGKAYSPVTVNVQGGGEATITIVSPTTTCAQIADALRAAVSASITRFIAIRELPHGTDECVAVCWSEDQGSISVYRNDSVRGGMNRFSYGSISAPVPQGAVFKIYGWGD